MTLKARNMILLMLTIAVLAFSVNKVQACVPPNVKVISPENKIYASNSVPLIFTVNTSTCWIGYVLDGQANVTIQGNTTITGLQDGSHYVSVFAKNKWGTGSSGRIDFAVDTTPPNIKDITQFPTSNNVQSQDIVKVNATVTDNLSGVKQVNLTYSFTNNNKGGNATVTMTNLEADIWNATIPMFLTGTNVSYTIKAEDNVGNTNTSQEMEYYINPVIPEFQSPFAALLIMGAMTITLTTAKHRLPRKKTQKATET